MPLLQALFPKTTVSSASMSFRQRMVERLLYRLTVLQRERHWSPMTSVFTFVIPSIRFSEFTSKKLFFWMVIVSRSEQPVDQPTLQLIRLMVKYCTFRNMPAPNIISFIPKQSTLQTQGHLLRSKPRFTM